MSDVPRGQGALAVRCLHGLAQRMVNARAFSLVELVLVVIIIGIIAAIALPRVTHAVDGAALAALEADLKAMRNALELYAAEHNGNYPGSLVAIARYTSLTGAMSSNPSATYRFGPYVHAIPPCPIGPEKGAVGWAAANANPPTVVSGSATVGWLYHASTGGVWVNDLAYLDQ